MSNKPKRKPSSTKRKTPAKQQQAPSPWGKRIGLGIGFVVVAGIVGVIAFSSEPVSGVPLGTETVAVEAPLHVDGELHEEGEVPAGGEHNPVWLNCGYYDTPVESEFAVHSLEHGAVWITYNPSIGADGVDQLRGLVRRDRKIIVSPVNDLEDSVLLTAWGTQLHLDSADDDRVAQFVNEFAGSASAPEPGASCSGGVGNPSF
ncbi:MAG: DUF3105 domain-containing protein [Actinomycetota bacterium]|nr:DUF3105 domain-containing protein [Actinomycetota bacterium]